MNDWSVDSWCAKVASQQPVYEDTGELNQVIRQLAALPPLVTSWEVEKLRDQLSEITQGKAFLLQGGDCCESFEDCNYDSIASKLKVLLQMSLVLVYGSKKRVIRVGRIGGQYAKPRSASTETRDGVTLASYRGDLVNRVLFDDASRRADPQLLLRGYERAALTLNLIRALSEGGFADLHHPENWDLGFVQSSPNAKNYNQLLDAIGESIRFMEVIGTVGSRELERVDFFTSHEGLHLRYEQAQTRTVPRQPGWYNLSAHMPWIGERTRSIDEAHVEYFRGIMNPIGVKIGPTASPEEVTRLVEILNPNHTPGRLTLIHRFGCDQIADRLPPILNAVKRTECPIVWSCDPMHGNTITTPRGWKTRRFDNILSELRDAFAIHRSAKSELGGVHLELTGENVTECVGGARDIEEGDLPKAYKSMVDPRLNYDQAMEIAFLIAQEMAG